MEYEEENEEEEIYDQPIIEPIISNSIKKEMEYRFFVIEGYTDSLKIQNAVCEALGMICPNITYDIIDTEEKILIEIKVSVQPFDTLLDQFELKKNEEKAELVVLGPDGSEYEGTGIYSNKEIFPGHHLSTDFLTKRHMYLMSRCSTLEEVTTAGLIQYDEREMQSCYTWSRPFLRSKDKIANNVTFDYKPIPYSLTMLNDKLKLNMDNRKAMKYNPKFTPYGLTPPTPSGENDHHSISLFSQLYSNQDEMHPINNSSIDAYKPLPIDRGLYIPQQDNSEL